MIIPPFLGYAEIHYRFGFLLTPLFRRRPEVVAEIPHRLQRGQNLPVLLIVKDAHRYPIRLLAVEARFGANGHYRFKVDQAVSEPYTDFIFKIPAAELRALSTGTNRVHIKIEYELRGKRYIIFNDNYPGVSHKALEFFLSGQPLPRFPGCLYGDLHTHTFFTNDQVEFGASLDRTAELSRAAGLQFFAATDHSYDLDDREDHFLRNDATLPKWNRFLQEVLQQNAAHPEFTIIPGEEVTVRNRKGKNVHLLVLNNASYFPGSGDSGERWWHTRSELTIPQIVSKLEPHTLAAAAHPAEQPPFLQKRLLGRGNWSMDDLFHNRLTLIQLINGTQTVDLSMWIKALLQGRQLILVAGNDAHGAFARNRYMHIPFVTIAESHSHLHGVWRTGVYGEQPAGVEPIVKALRSGAVFCTNGPALHMEAVNGNERKPMGSTTARAEQVHIRLLSTAEFGSLSRFTLWAGHKQKEILLYEHVFPEAQFKWDQEIDLPAKTSYRYIRSQVTTNRNGKTYTAISNPIWFKTET